VGVWRLYTVSAERPGSRRERVCAVYRPDGYDEGRAEPYPVLYVCLGSDANVRGAAAATDAGWPGGREAGGRGELPDWLRGSLAWIGSELDRMIAEGSLPPVLAAAWPGESRSATSLRGNDSRYGGDDEDDRRHEGGVCDSGATDVDFGAGDVDVGGMRGSGEGAAGGGWLKEFVERTFRAAGGRDGRYLVGVGGGCREALRQAMLAPSRYAAATLLCPDLRTAEAPRAEGRGRLAAETADDVGGVDEAGVARTLRLDADVSAWIAAYARQAVQVPLYLVAGSAEDDRSSASGLEADEFATEAQAVALYAALCRRNLYGLDFPKESDVPASPGHLRIVAGGTAEDAKLAGFREGARRMLGAGPERSDWSPTFEPGRDRPVKKGTVSSLAVPVSGPAGESLPMGRIECVAYTPYGFIQGASRRYPVLYLLHGSGGTAASWDEFWPVLDALIERGDIPPAMAIAPVTGNSYWVDSIRYGAVETAIVRDLAPAIEAAYPVATEREGRLLVGYSMGGYGALRYALRYPETFGGAVLLSPAIQDGEAPATSGAVLLGAFGVPFDPADWRAKSYAETLPGFAAKGLPVPMYIAAGDADWNHVAERDDLPADAERYNMEAQAVSLYLRLRRINPTELRIVGGGHTMHVWAQGFEAGLRYLFRANQAAHRA